MRNRSSEKEEEEADRLTNSNANKIERSGAKFAPDLFVSETEVGFEPKLASEDERKFEDENADENA